MKGQLQVWSNLESEFSGAREIESLGDRVSYNGNDLMVFAVKIN